MSDIHAVTTEQYLGEKKPHRELKCVHMFVSVAGCKHVRVILSM